jgi:hypothetical protein
MVLFLACSSEPDRVDLARSAATRAVGWMEAHADPTPRELDVPIGLSAIAARLPSPDAAALDGRLRPALDRPGDPRRRLYDPGARLPEPPPPAVRDGTLQSNGALVEALYCAEHGFRPETLAALCGGFRDGGGYGSTHAAWFLAEALDRGCLARAATCADAVQREVVEAPIPSLAATLDRDLLAERLLFGLRLDADPDALGPAVDALVGAQAPDGGLGVAREGEPLWWSWHATLVTAWGLSEWVARSEGR